MENNDLGIINNQSHEPTLANQNASPSINPLKQYSHKDLPADMALKMHLGRLGIIFSNYSILGVILLFSTFLFFFGYALFYLLLLSISIITLGLIYVIAPGFADLWNVSDKMDGIISFISGASGYIALAVLVFSIASMILLWVDKNNRSIPRIIFAMIMGIISIIFIIGALVK